MPKLKRVSGFALAMVAVVSTGCESPTNGTVSNYPAHCEGRVDRVANSCSGKLTFTLNRRTFSVDAQQQRVIEQFVNPGALPVRLEGCTVKDVDNWSCNSLRGGKSYTQMMSHGAYNEFGFDIPNDDVVYLARAEWERLEKGQMIDGLHR
jgi:hypothetical protein